VPGRGGCRADPTGSGATAAAVDNEARQACATLTAGSGRATSTAERLALADRVNRWSAGSDNRVGEHHGDSEPAVENRPPLTYAAAFSSA
jgi:hypothetical protein